MVVEMNYGSGQLLRTMLLPKITYKLCGMPVVNNYYECHYLTHESTSGIEYYCVGSSGCSAVPAVASQLFSTVVTVRAYTEIGSGRPC